MGKDHNLLSKTTANALHQNTALLHLLLSKTIEYDSSKYNLGRAIQGIRRSI